MDSAIDYLNEVHRDLLDAARRERERLRVVRTRRRRFPTNLVAAAASIVVVAGLIGLAVRSGGFGSEEAVPGSARRAVGATGAATGATGGAAPEDQAYLPSVAPTEHAPGANEPVSRVIRTAELSLVIPRDAFDDRFAEVVDAAEANGGFVASSTTRDRSGRLTMRVPAANFDETLRALRDLGTVDVESVHGQDVTADYVDLRARLRIARSRREVLLGLMADATSIGQTIRVQNALDQTQLRIEELQGQLRLLDDRTSLATIDVRLREEGVEPEAEIEAPSIPNAFERAIAGFVGVIAAIVIGLGYLLPLIALGLAGWFVLRLVQRRRRG